MIRELHLGIMRAQSVTTYLPTQPKPFFLANQKPEKSYAVGSFYIGIILQRKKMCNYVKCDREEIMQNLLPNGMEISPGKRKKKQ